MSDDEKQPGRPPLPEGKAKSVVFTLRLTPAEKAALEKAAERDGMRVTRWARAVLLSAAG